MAKEKPGSPGSALAERLRAGIEEAEAEKRRSALERQRQESSAKQRRIALMGDLEAFGRAVEHLRITHRWGTLTLRYQSRSLRFKAAGGEVVVSGDNLAGAWRCMFEPELRKWVLEVTKDTGTSERIMLFDAGLARMMSTALGLG